MPRITVSAIILDGPRLLLAREPGAEAWALPGGPLDDLDESVEDAIARVLAERWSVDITDQLFLDTLFEQRAGEVVVHNVFSVVVAATGLRDTTQQGGVQFRWTHVDELEEAPLASWLGPSLRSLLAGGEAIPPAIDFAGVGFSFEERAGGGEAAVSDVVRAPVLIVTGPAGAGKSTVSRAICARLPRAAHIQVDQLRDIIVSGYASPVPGRSDPIEAERQSDLALYNAAALARNCSAAGFYAVIDEVLSRSGELDQMLDLLVGYDVAFITLLPDVDTVRTRDSGRSEDVRMGQRALDLHAIFSALNEERGLRLDTSAMSVEETVDCILEHIDEAWVARAWA